MKTMPSSGFPLQGKRRAVDEFNTNGFGGGKKLN